MTAPLNPEIKAMKAIARALEPLNDEEIRRVVLYVTAWWYGTTQDAVARALSYSRNIDQLPKSDPWTGLPVGELPAR